MQEQKIKAAIAAYLEELAIDGSVELRVDLAVNGLYAAIAPYMGEVEKDLSYNELFNHMANEHNLTLTNTELGDIIHIARK